ncbi:hypothetical protein [Micromonospora sp. WMMD998]|uniref:hypothetical protein n=1 Tax=Micromonospora sp. WMMD998 TaxID=3016092 RepID=UPI00249BB705|nr:hypothetical protein [Micromonospora sp. WMMD998]WFE39296.1 hypothetical protein O7619_13045 [Micromonospora sp. WMMD998]
MFEFMRGAEFTALAFGDEAVGGCEAVVGRGGPANALRVLDVRRASPGSADAVRAIYGAAPDSLFVVRPDGHVGLVAVSRFAEELGRYLPLLAGGGA